MKLLRRIEEVFVKNNLRNNDAMTDAGRTELRIPIHDTRPTASRAASPTSRWKRRARACRASGYAPSPPRAGARWTVCTGWNWCGSYRTNRPGRLRTWSIRPLPPGSRWNSRSRGPYAGRTAGCGRAAGARFSAR